MGETRRPLDHGGGASVVRSGGQAGFGLVEAIIAIVLLGIGTVAVAGLTLTAGTYANRAAVETDQTLASSQVFSELREDFSSASSGTESVLVGDHTYRVDVEVSQPSADVKRVVAVVSGVGPFPPDTFHTRIHKSGSYPTSP